MICFVQFYNKLGRVVEIGFLFVNNFLEDLLLVDVSIIINCIIEIMDKFSLDFRKLLFFVFDGVVVMIGSRLDVVIKLKELNF